MTSESTGFVRSGKIMIFPCVYCLFVEGNMQMASMQRWRLLVPGRSPLGPTGRYTVTFIVTVMRYFVNV